MSKQQARARVSHFARQTVDIHLPVLVGLMAEEGHGPDDQSRRASRLVKLLRSARVASSLASNGRPIPLQVENNGVDPKLLINGEMLSRVDDTALAAAMAETVAEILEVSPVATGLVLQTSDEQQIRGLAGQLGAPGTSEIISLTQVEQLVRWRLEMFEQRLYGLVDGLGGWLEAPVVPRDDFVEQIAQMNTRWPEWRQVADHDYVRIWLEEIDAELGPTEWADSTEALAEMLWDSVAISARSALRRAAQSLRALATDGDRRQLLEVLADIVGVGDEPVDDSLDNWPNFSDLQQAWTDLWREEDDVIGARRRIRRIPEVSVFAPPGVSMGFSEPENLPWDQPLLCWTRRERDSLRDLIAGMETSLARDCEQFRVGRLTEHRGEHVGPPAASDSTDRQWFLQVPTKLPAPADGFSRAVDVAFASIRAGYEVAFSNLSDPMKQRAMKLGRGAYGGFLQSTLSIWKRRLAGIDNAERDEAFRMMITGVAEALEWPIFIDVFESGIDLPPLASMPTFTVPAVWYEGVDFAPLWLPVETIGESFDQATLRIRNVAVADNKQVRWLGDHQVQMRDLQELSVTTLLRSVHEGTLLLTIHER